MLLQVSALGCERDRRQLFADLTFTLEAGSLLQVVGANGSGKSTLLRILAGLYSDYEGEVLSGFDGAPLYLGHKPGIKSGLTVSENLNWLMTVRYGGADPVALESVLAEVSLAGFEDTLCGQLSEGQKKRVALAGFFLSELIGSEPVWFMDEPFSAIDADGLAAQRALFSRQIAAGGSIIFSTHQKLDFDHPVPALEL